MTMRSSGEWVLYLESWRGTWLTDLRGWMDRWVAREELVRKHETRVERNKKVTDLL